MNFTNPIAKPQEQEKKGVFFENHEMDSLAAKLMNMQR